MLNEWQSIAMLERREGSKQQQQVIKEHHT